MPSKIINPVKEFVKELNGRYNEYVSDVFLEALLIEAIKIEYNLTKNLALNNIAYNIGCKVFEELLEYHCKAGGNGHHVAQDLAKRFV